MKQKKKYPKTAMVVASVAFVLFLAGFGNFVFFFPAGFLGLIALIFALGPDTDYKPSPLVVHRVFSESGYRDSNSANCLYGKH